MPPKISEAEWKVMKLLWSKSPITANEVVEIMQKEVNWNHRTIRTLINQIQSYVTP